MRVFDYLTPEDVAKRLKVSLHTLENWRSLRKKGKDKGPPFFNLNGKRGAVRYCEDQLERWIDQCYT